MTNMKEMPKKRCEEDPLNLLKGISFMFVNYAKNQPVEQSIDFSPRKKSKPTPFPRAASSSCLQMRGG